MRLRLVVLLSGGGRTLLNLCDAVEQGRLEAVFPLVISSRRTAAGVELSRDRGLRVEIVRPRDFADGEDFARAQTQLIASVRPHLVVMAGYLVHYPVPPGWEGRLLNIHPSLLPRHGGRGLYGDRVHAAVLAAGERESGCSVHVVDDVYDSGPLLAQARVPVRADDSVESLAARVFEAECATYPQAIASYARRLAEQGRLKPLSRS